MKVPEIVNFPQVLHLFTFLHFVSLPFCLSVFSILGALLGTCFAFPDEGHADFQDGQNTAGTKAKTSFPFQQEVHLFPPHI